MKDSGVGWIGEIPPKWKNERVKNLFREVSIKGYPSAPLLAATQHAGVILKSEVGWRTMEAKVDGRENFKLVCKDDFVISLRSFEGGIEKSSVKGIISPAYTVLRLRDANHCAPEYFKYFFKSSAFLTQLKQHQKGIRDGQAIPFNTLEYDFIAVPPFAEQRAIADYLDQQTALIDQRLSTLEEKKTVLAELRKATIHEAVTKGAIWDGDTGEVENLPAGWVMVRIKDVAKLRSGDFVSAEKIESNGEFPVYGGNGLRGYTDSFTHNGEFALVGRQGALCGNINYAKGKFWATEHAVVVRHKRKMVTRWLGEMLCCMNLNQYATASAQPGLSVEIVINKFLPLPPLDEQSAIANHLDQQTQHIDAQLATLDEQAQVLKELRKAIIHEAVTGKIDLSGVVSGKEKR